MYMYIGLILRFDHGYVTMAKKCVHVYTNIRFFARYTCIILNIKHYIKLFICRHFPRFQGTYKGERKLDKRGNFLLHVYDFIRTNKLTNHASASILYTCRYNIYSLNRNSYIFYKVNIMTGK